MPQCSVFGKQVGSMSAKLRKINILPQELLLLSSNLNET